MIYGHLHQHRQEGKALYSHNLITVTASMSLLPTTVWDQGYLIPRLVPSSSLAPTYCRLCYDLLTFTSALPTITSSSHCDLWASTSTQTGREGSIQPQSDNSNSLNAVAAMSLLPTTVWDEAISYLDFSPYLTPRLVPSSSLAPTYCRLCYDLLTFTSALPTITSSSHCDLRASTSLSIQAGRESSIVISVL